MIDKKKIEKATRLLLEGIGENPRREGLRGTPKRVARMWEELFKVKKTKIQAFESNYGAMIIVKDMDFSSTCEHHLLPFIGKIHIGYIPSQDGRVVGLSKLWRISEKFTRRLQLQERLTQQIAQELSRLISPMGVGVIIEARHLCMGIRGVLKPGAITITSAMGGVMEGQATREEFLKLVYAGRGHNG